MFGYSILGRSNITILVTLIVIAIFHDCDSRRLFSWMDKPVSFRPRSSLKAMRSSIGISPIRQENVRADFKRFDMHGNLGNLIGIRGGKDKRRTSKESKSHDHSENEKITTATEEEESFLKGLDGVEPENEAMYAQDAGNYVTTLLKKSPPFTKAFVGSSIVLTLLTFMFNRNEWPEILLLDWYKTIFHLQFWRPLTTFLYFGPFGISYVLTMQFVWQYMSQLEKLSYDKPENFVTMVLYGSVSLMLCYFLGDWSIAYLGHNLSTFLVYIWSKVHEGEDVNVMDLFTLRAELIPWYFCLQTAILDSMFPWTDILGIAIGNCYFYFRNKNIIKPPQFLQRLCQEERVKKLYDKFRSDLGV